MNVLLNADIAEAIFLWLDGTSLSASELVCKQWREVIIESRIWKKLVKRKCTSDILWRKRCEEKGWFKYLDATESEKQPNCHALYNKIHSDLELLRGNWKDLSSSFHIRYSSLNPEMTKVYCFHYNNEVIRSGHQDNTIKTWHRHAPNNTPSSLPVHAGSVLSLQFDEKIMVSCSSDGSIKIFNMREDTEPNCIRYSHSESPLNIKFHNGTLVAGYSKGTVVVWEMLSSTNVRLKGEMKEHGASVNAVDIDDQFIVSGSGDRIIKVWDREKLCLVKNLTGHRRGVTCLHLREEYVASGSTDKSVRLWNILTGECLQLFYYHTDIVRSVQMNHEYVVSGSYDKTVVVWDKFHTEYRPNAVIKVLTSSEDPILHVKIDEFKIVASNTNNEIFIWDFLDWIPYHKF